MNEIKKMSWEKLLSNNRLGKKNDLDDELGRTQFHKDYDRIVFSGAFRRLSKKTQVHPLASNDHLHNRLSHSLEVACVGRSLGMIVGEKLKEQFPCNISPSDIGVVVQSACLAHDIGNPPFGHAGEFAIRDWFQNPNNQKYLEKLNIKEQTDLKTFEGNAQGLRILTQIECHFLKGGLRLTYATIGSYVKYPWSSLCDLGQGKGKFGYFQSEHSIFEEIANTIGLIKTGDYSWCRHPLANLMEAADDICYALLDLEDGVELGLISFEEVEKLLLNKICNNDKPDNYDDIPKIFCRRKMAVLRGKAMGYLVNSVAQAFINNVDKILYGQVDKDLFSYCDKDISEGIKTAKDLAKDKIFNDRRKNKLEIAAYSTLGILLQAFCGAVYEVKNDEKPSFKSIRLIDLLGYNAPDKKNTLYESYMRVIDYIAGMTDNYATYMAQQISGVSNLSS